MAEKIGTGPRAVADAESGKPATGIVVYFALLWALGLISEVSDIADPTKDEVGLRLALIKEKSKPYPTTKGELDNDF